MKKFFYILRKSLTQKVTLMFIFHSPYGPIKKHFTFLFIISMFFLWTLFTGFTVYLATKHFDYWTLKLKSVVLGTKYEYINKELSKTWELLAKVEENNNRLRELLNMKSKKNIILNTPDDLLNQGGPTNIEQSKFLKQISETPGEVPLINYKSHFDLIKQQIEEHLKSYNEVVSYIKLQKNLYKSTPLIWPCEGKVVSPFGYRIHPLYRIEHFHTGIDIANEYGTPIRATADGFIKFAGWQQGYGKAVLIQHDFGYSTIYGHLSSIKVKQGQKISRGEIIGLMGDTGTTTGPHLHYEIWKDNKLCNPIKYVNPEDFFKNKIF